MSGPKNPAAVALQALRKTRGGGGAAGGRVKSPRKGMGSATPEQIAERVAKMVAARKAKVKPEG